VLHRFEHESAVFHVFGLQEDKSGGTGLQKKKMLSLAEMEKLQVCKKSGAGAYAHPQPSTLHPTRTP
jgi:hypothetical protein